MLQYFEHVEEAEWAVQVLKTSGKPVAASLCIGPDGDLNRVSPGDCAVRLVNAGTTTSQFTVCLNIQSLTSRKMWRNNLLRVSLYLMTPTETWFRALSLRGDTSDCDVKGAVCKIAMWTLGKDGFKLLVTYCWHIKSQWLSSQNRKCCQQPLKKQFSPCVW